VKRSTERILTTQVGSLPRPADLMALYAADAPEENLQPRLHSAVGDIVRQQIDSGIDVVNDGEFGKAMRSSMDPGPTTQPPKSLVFQTLREKAPRSGAISSQAVSCGGLPETRLAEFRTQSLAEIILVLAPRGLNLIGTGRAVDAGGSTPPANRASSPRQHRAGAAPPRQPRRGAGTRRRE
jgi:hypothetical protein